MSYTGRKRSIGAQSINSVVKPWRHRDRRWCKQERGLVRRDDQEGGSGVKGRRRPLRTGPTSSVAGAHPSKLRRIQPVYRAQRSPGCRRQRRWRLSAPPARFKATLLSFDQSQPCRLTSANCSLPKVLPGGAVSRKLLLGDTQVSKVSSLLVARLVAWCLTR